MLYKSEHNDGIQSINEGRFVVYSGSVKNAHETKTKADHVTSSFLITWEIKLALISTLRNYFVLWKPKQLWVKPAVMS